MSENHCSLIIQGNVVPEYSISDLFENYNYSKNRFLNSIPRPLNLLKHYDVKKLGLERKKKTKVHLGFFLQQVELMLVLVLIIII